MKKLIVALDFPSSQQAIDVARRLVGTIRWIKIGLELFCQSGPDIVQTMKDMGFKVFLDLKFMDIPNTVQGAVASAARIGADMLTIHITGGKEMIVAAQNGLLQASISHTPLLMGVTVLTSMDIRNLADTLPLAATTEISHLVQNMSQQAQNWGLDGVVCSGQEAGLVRTLCPPPFMIVTPGIRMDQSQDDQKRTMTPSQAIAMGSNFLVVGRPITRAKNPLYAAQSYLREIKEYL